MKRTYENGATDIYDAVEEAIRYGIEPTANRELWTSLSQSTLQKRKQLLKETIKAKTKSKKRKSYIDIPDICMLPPVSKKLRHLSQKEYSVYMQVLKFEHSMMNVKLVHCPCCMSKSTTIYGKYTKCLYMTEIIW